MDKKVFSELEKINGSNNEESLFPEHEFITTCLRIGLRIEDLKQLTYVDVLKILISFIGKNDKREDGARKATTEEIKNLVARL